MTAGTFSVRQRALKIADACKTSANHLPLFVEILDAYVLHYGAGNEAIVPKYISSLMQLIEQQQEGAPPPHFEAVKKEIALRRENDERWAEVEVEIS